MHTGRPCERPAFLFQKEGHPLKTRKTRKIPDRPWDSDPRTGLILAAAIEVHKTLGPGFLESVYQEALELEFESRQIPFKREVGLAIDYKGTILGCTYRVDFVCFDAILLELKALASLGTPEVAQMINYLKCSGGHLGLVVNFGATRIQIKRLVHGRNGGGRPVEDRPAAASTRS